MCGRYGRRADKQRIAEWMETHDDNVFDESYFAPSFNIAPQSMQPVVRLGRDTSERELTVMRWGLVPHWILLAKSRTGSDPLLPRQVKRFGEAC
jgi:putative SOS response-associated peptidase YedK